MKRTIRHSSVLLGLVLTGAWGISPAMPDVQTNDRGVEYVAGGIGLDESQEMSAAAAKWPLTLEFAARSGRGAEYLADVDVHILDAQGREVLATTADGPYLLARLSPGHYKVEATAEGDKLTQRVTVQKGRAARVAFIWPRSANE